MKIYKAQLNKQSAIGETRLHCRLEPAEGVGTLIGMAKYGCDTELFDALPKAGLDRSVLNSRTPVSITEVQLDILGVRFDYTH